MDKLIINLTPTGMVPTKSMTPHVPVSVAEIVDDVLAGAELGASMVHLHARDGEGEPTPDPEIFAEIIRGIRAVNPELVLCATTSGRVHRRLSDRLAVLELSGDAKPDMASLTLSSLNFARAASINQPDTIQALATRMAERGIVPELEVFDTGMINYAHYLMKKGIVGTPGYFNILLGNVATAQADERVVDLMIDMLPEGACWALAGIGNCQAQVHEWAVQRGGHVRVGLEDNIWFDDARTTLATNRSLLERVREMADRHGREIATPEETRRRLGLSEWSNAPA